MHKWSDECGGCLVVISTRCKPVFVTRGHAASRTTEGSSSYEFLCGSQSIATNGLRLVRNECSSDKDRLITGVVPEGQGHLSLTPNRGRFRMIATIHKTGKVCQVLYRHLSWASARKKAEHSKKLQFFAKWLKTVRYIALAVAAQFMP